VVVPVLVYISMRGVRSPRMKRMSRLSSIDTLRSVSTMESSMLDLTYATLRVVVRRSLFSEPGIKSQLAGGVAFRITGKMSVSAGS